MPRVNDDDDLLAAEFALGLLDEVEAADVQARARTDAALSLRIAWWRDQLAPLAAEIEVEAPVGTWARIERRLGANDNAPALMRRWRAAAIAAMSVAAALVAVIAVKPGPAPVPVPTAIRPQAPEPMIAALAGGKGNVVSVSYDAASGALTVAPAVLDPGKGDAELWVIPEDGVPRSLGVVSADAPLHAQVARNHRRFIHAGATFAITQEVKGGSPSGAPGGPIVASGKIIEV